jgi:hypothetical protein
MNGPGVQGQLLKWRMNGLKPFECYHASHCHVTADAKGRAKWFLFDTVHRRYPDLATEAYYPDEQLPPGIIPIPLKDATAGQWVIDAEGTVALVLEIRILGKGCQNDTVVTVFGLTYRRGTVPLARNRIAHSTFAQKESALEHRIHRFSYRYQKIVFMFLMCGLDEVETFKRIYMREPKNGEATTMMVNALRTPESRWYLTMSIEKMLTEAGVNPESWMKKILDSTQGNIKSSTQWDMWKTLGSFIPQIRKELAIARGDEPPQEGQARFGTGDQTKDAEFKDVCSVCGDKLVYKAKFTDGQGNTQEADLPCPLCEAKRNAMPKLQAGSGLRV